MNNTFENLKIIPPILKAIEELGFKEPTEVQAKAIPHILEKEDVIVISKTGSGKTAVFGITMLQLTDPDKEGPLGLVLTPTRELAAQVNNDIKLLSKYLPHKMAVVYGQHNINLEVRELEKGVTIVTGTPGRVFDHINQGTLDTRNIRFLVLDEADRMLDMGFLDQVENIIRSLPRKRITLLFSATIPQEIRRICRKYMKNPVTVEIESPTKTVDTIKQFYYRVEEKDKNYQLDRLLLVEQPRSCMIFCNTKLAVDSVQRFLAHRGYAALALHGDIPQFKRMKTIHQFKKGLVRILVATDVASRGIHVDDLSLVINYDVPQDKDNYIHRIGRTGRAGNEGCAISLVTVDDIMTLYEIEEHIGVLIEEKELPSDELLNERKAAAEEWLKANSLPADTSGPGRKKGGSSYKGNFRESREGAGGSRKKTANNKKRTINERRTINESRNLKESRTVKENRPNWPTSKENTVFEENSEAGNKAAEGGRIFDGTAIAFDRIHDGGETAGKAANKAVYNSADEAADRAAANVPSNASFFKRVIQHLFGKKG